MFEVNTIVKIYKDAKSNAILFDVVSELDNQSLYRIIAYPQNEYWGIAMATDDLIAKYDWQEVALNLYNSHNSQSIISQLQINHNVSMAMAALWESYAINEAEEYGHLLNKLLNRISPQYNIRETRMESVDDKFKRLSDRSIKSIQNIVNKNTQKYCVYSEDLFEAVVTLENLSPYIRITGEVCAGIKEAELVCKNLEKEGFKCLNDRYPDLIKNHSGKAVILTGIIP